MEPHNRLMSAEWPFSSLFTPLLLFLLFFLSTLISLFSLVHLHVCYQRRLLWRFETLRRVHSEMGPLTRTLRALQRLVKTEVSPRAPLYA